MSKLDKAAFAAITTILQNLIAVDDAYCQALSGWYEHLIRRESDPDRDNR